MTPWFTLSYHTYSGHDMTLDQLFEGYNYGHDCHHYAHATIMAMILMMQFVNLDICLQDVKMPKLWGRLLPIIYPFHNRQSKIHPRKNHNYYYYVCMSTAFMKGVETNPVGFTDCSPTNCQNQPTNSKLERTSYLLVQPSFLFNWQNFLFFFQSSNIHADFSSAHKRAMLST